jgi:hypothetical protein
MKIRNHGNKSVTVPAIRNWSYLFTIASKFITRKFGTLVKDSSKKYHMNKVYGDDRKNFNILDDLMRNQLLEYKECVYQIEGMSVKKEKKSC